MDMFNRRIKQFEEDTDSIVNMFAHAQNCQLCMPPPNLYLCPEALSIGGPTAERFYKEELARMPVVSENPVDTLLGYMRPIAAASGLEVDEEAVKKARDFCEETIEIDVAFPDGIWHKRCRT